MVLLLLVFLCKKAQPPCARSISSLYWHKQSCSFCICDWSFHGNQRWLRLGTTISSKVALHTPCHSLNSVQVSLQCLRKDLCNIHKCQSRPGYAIGPHSSGCPDYLVLLCASNSSWLRQQSSASTQWNVTESDGHDCWLCTKDKAFEPIFTVGLANHH